MQASLSIRDDLVARQGKGDGRARMAVHDRQRGRLHVDGAVGKQFGGCQRHAAVVLLDAGLDQVMRFELSQHGAAAFDDDLVAQADAKVPARAMRSCSRTYRSRPMSRNCS
ncbi:MAG: hypothetical protein MZV64_18950 [Ignavibacteriales bacterium]|nr:hypothetical protein [Ignavibacteriales bacterium]